MKKVIIFLLAFIAVVASAGCLNYAHISHQGFYTFIGIANLLGTAFAVYAAVKKSSTNEK